MSEVHEQLKLLADPTRMRILEFLADPKPSLCSRDEGVCGCDLEGLLGYTQPTVSYHMKLLGEAGLVRSERRGSWVFSELEPAAFRNIAAAMHAFADAAERAQQAQRVADGVPS